MLRQVYFNGQQSAGFTFARIANSWAFSFPLEGSPWLSPIVFGTEYHQDGANIINEVCEIAHISKDQHVSHWQQNLCDWERNIAKNNVIGIVAEHCMEMYPLDHAYPHVHLVDSKLCKTLAKYRIDKFERMEGPPRWDSEVRIWVEHNRDELLRSWVR